MSTKPTINELLALRDGDELEVSRARELESDAAVREALHDLREVRQSLRDLPDVAPSPEAWERIRAAQAQGRPASSSATGWLHRFPMAAAASVFFAAMIGMLVWQPFNAGAPVETVALGDLVNRSQQLEAQVGLPVRNSITSSESALFYRLADIDAELTALDSQKAGAGLSPEDERWRRMLWQRRVELLESLRTVQQAEQPEFTYAVY